MSIFFKPDKDVVVTKAKAGHVPLLILRPEKPVANAPGVLWNHGGGYMMGMKEMVYGGYGQELVKRYGAVVVAPGYRLSWQKPYPAAIEDCYDALKYLHDHREEFGIGKIMVGGESAGGGLTAALCMMARDRGEIHVAYQMPLYPMISNIDTESSRDNHGKVWNTRLNHLGWKLYLRKNAKEAVSPYAAAAQQTDYTNLPPCYTFIGDGEPFYTETLQFVENLKAAGVEASADVYHTDVHSFDTMQPETELAQRASAAFYRHFEYAMEHYS